jgi:hypothetical protein
MASLTALARESAGHRDAPRIEADTMPTRLLKGIDANRIQIESPYSTSNTLPSNAGEATDDAPVTIERGPVKLDISEPASQSDSTGGRPNTVTYTALAQWVGHVTAVRGDEFDCQLEADDSSSDDLSATFSLEEVLPDDQHLVASGAVFFWHVGYEDAGTGRKRVSQFTFQRLPARRTGEVERAVAKAKAVRDRIQFTE